MGLLDFHFIITSSIKQFPSWRCICNARSREAQTLGLQIQTVTGNIVYDSLLNYWNNTLEEAADVGQEGLDKLSETQTIETEFVGFSDHTQIFQFIYFT